MRTKGLGRSQNRLATAALLIAVLGGVLLYMGSRGGAEAAGVEADTRATLGVFRSIRTTGDELPSDATAALRAADDAQPGEDPSLSRRVAHPDGAVYVWPMADGVCHSSPAGGGCVPIRTIREKGVDISVRSILNLQARTYQEVRVFGIARDGVDSVRLTLQSGAERTADVRENTFFALDLPDRPAAVSWTDGTGAHSIDVPGQPAEELAAQIVGP